MRLGSVELEIVSDGTFALDGGAMFGVVPRVLWERQLPADAQHRVRLGLNCLLIRTASDNILIDTGIGTKWDARSRSRYGIAHETTLLDELTNHQLAAQDITIVINTHLHFDHAGTNTIERQGRVVPTFPRARYIAQRGEFEHACQPHERDRASYMQADFEPVFEAGQFEMVDGDAEVAPGVSVIKVSGHNRDLQCVKIESEGETAFAFADLVPTTAHLPAAWVMGYDLYPLEAVEQKKRLVPQAAREGWLCHFYHDPRTPLARLREHDGKIIVERLAASG
jgi:glyoxylase-like metal-dependent hydrolase (beta-lactamase superfamily II)